MSFPGPPAATVAVAALLVVAVVPAAAHVNHVAADAQVTGDGAVVVETAFAAVPAWLAVRADDAGEPGEPLGWTKVPAEFVAGERVAFRTDDWEPGPMWVVLHHPDGDGNFEPAEDEPISSFGSPVRERIRVERGPTALVLAAGFSPQETATPNVTVAEVRLPADGAVVLRNATGDGPGEAVGSRSLSAGTHRNVTVGLDPGFYERRPASFALWATLRTADGPVTAGGEPVGSRFGVVRTDATDATPTEPVVITPEGTATPTQPATATPTPSASTSPTGGSGPGFGALAALAALVGALALARRNRG